MTATADERSEYIASRFPMITLSEARKRAAESVDWVFDGIVFSAITLIYGRSNVGKSYLVTSMLLALMIEDRTFLGMQPTEEKMWRPAILYTDPGSAEEYGKRFAQGAPDDDLDVPFYWLGVTRTADEWEALADHLIATGRNFIVLDNLTGATGDPNDALAASIVFDGLNRLVARGVPVVVLHHETEKGKTAVGAGPIGVGEPVRKSRVWIQVRQSQRKRLRGGNTALYVQGNALDRHWDIVAEPLSGPDYRVITKKPVEETGSGEDDGSRERGKDTLDSHAESARWIVDHCQGMTVTKTAEALAANTGRTTAGVLKDIQGGGRWSDLLTRSGKTWSLVSP